MSKIKEPPFTPSLAEKAERGIYFGPLSAPHEEIGSTFFPPL